MNLLRHLFHSSNLRQGFSAPEALVALAVGAVALGAAAVAYSTVAKVVPRAKNLTTITVPNAASMYTTGGATRTVPVAPAYGLTARAESMRERFLQDTLGATAIYTLARDNAPTAQYRPALIPYDPITATPIDTSDNFRNYLVTAGLVPSTQFATARNFYPANLDSTLVQPTWNGCSIYILGFSPYEAHLAVTAVYEVDLYQTNTAVGLTTYASVRRYSGRVTAFTPGNPATFSQTVALTDYYEFCYEPLDLSGTNSPRPRNFAPLWVAFERSSRLAFSEGTIIDRFKVAKEKPFTFIWWPDPCARDIDLVTTSNTSIPPTDPRHVYNHMGGRTAYMFTVPTFPAL
jgi:hypothetical protein